MKYVLLTNINNLYHDEIKSVSLLYILKIIKLLKFVFLHKQKYIKNCFTYYQYYINILIVNNFILWWYNE